MYNGSNKLSRFVQNLKTLTLNYCHSSCMPLGLLTLNIQQFPQFRLWEDFLY